MRVRSNPHLYEINSRVWLRRLREKYGHKLTLGNVPAKEWERLRQLGFDYVWLMGVWMPSRKGVEIAASLPALQIEYGKALPEWSRSDIIGSPYAIASYELNPELGAREDLETVRKNLNEMGLGLILDFVPNHMAVDHPWTNTHPEFFVQGDEEEVQRDPTLFFKVGGVPKGHILAHGRDPYFPPWFDTAQLNFFEANTWSALFEILRTIAKKCDGLRCDMAMLILNEVFQKNWGRLVKKAGYSRPGEEFWRVAIADIKARNADFVFIAEAYWGLDRRLIQLGFDFAYDKTLYDYLLNASAKDLRAHLMTEPEYQRHRVSFIENHDELRAVAAFGREKSKAAAVVISTLPGLRLFHNGQLEGRGIRIPVQLARVKPEPDDPDIIGQYQGLLRFADHQVLHEGKWTLLDVRCASQEDRTQENLLAWMWSVRESSKIVIVNYSSFSSQGFVLLPIDLRGREIVLFDELMGKGEKLPRELILKEGLYVRLGPYQSRFFTLQGNSHFHARFDE